MKGKKWIGAVLVIIIFAAGILLGILWTSRQNAESGDSTPSGSGQKPDVSASESVPPVSDSTEETSKPENEPDSSEAPESKSEIPSSSAAEPTVSPQGENVVYGTIVDAAMNSILVKEDETGREIDFSRDTADVSGRIVVDAKVEVYYTGEINGNDASEVFVTRIVSKA